MVDEHEQQQQDEDEEPPVDEEAGSADDVADVVATLNDVLSVGDQHQAEGLDSGPRLLQTSPRQQQGVRQGGRAEAEDFELVCGYSRTQGSNLLHRLFPKGTLAGGRRMSRTSRRGQAAKTSERSDEPLACRAALPTSRQCSSSSAVGSRRAA